MKEAVAGATKSKVINKKDRGQARPQLLLPPTPKGKGINQYINNNNK